MQSFLQCHISSFSSLFSFPSSLFPSLPLLLLLFLFFSILLPLNLLSPSLFSLLIFLPHPPLDLFPRLPGPLLHPISSSRAFLASLHTLLRSLLVIFPFLSPFLSSFPYLSYICFCFLSASHSFQLMRDPVAWYCSYLTFHFTKKKKNGISDDIKILFPAKSLELLESTFLKS